MAKRRRNYLPKSFFYQPTEIVAKELLGCTFHRIMPDGSEFVARIAETEAYLGHRDPASHAYKGESKRNYSMFRDGGRFYVYLIYGMYFCINVVTQVEGHGEAVLIRALQPLDGHRDQHLMGPGRLCRYLGINKKFDGADCSGNEIWIEKGAVETPIKMKKGCRVGLNAKLGKCTEWKLRFYLPGFSTVKEK